MTEKRFYTIHKGVYDELKRKELHHGEITSMLNALHEENEQLKQYRDAIMNWDSSKIIRVNMNTGEVDLVDKELIE